MRKIQTQVESLFERVPRRRNNRWSEVEEQVEVEVGDSCWGCGAQTCVFKRGRHGRMICRPLRPGWASTLFVNPYFAESIVQATSGRNNLHSWERIPLNV